MEIYELLPILMLIALVSLLFTGLPVAMVLFGIGITFSLIGVALGEMPAIALYNITLKMSGSVSGSMVYVAVVFLLFMGVSLEKSGIARDLLICLRLLLRRVPGGLALAVIIIGVILAPAAGLVGASVVTLTLIAMPSLLAQGYRPETASSSIAAAGTVGIILPPAVMLFFLASAFEVTIGGMFLATVVPGMILVGFYLLYFFLNGLFNPTVDALTDDGIPADVAGWTLLLLRGLVLPVALVSLVLGAIIFGWATPRQASALGAGGGLALMLINGRLNWTLFKEVATTTATLSAMVFFIIIAASVFTYPFVFFGGNDVIAAGLEALDLGSWGMLLTILLIIFLLGFFVDWIEITIIFLPLFLPVLKALDFAAHAPDKLGMIWMATLVALTLQTSFLTPPFGFALFFLKGAAPEGVGLHHIYRGIVPIVIAQIAGIALLLALPVLATWLPLRIYG